MLTEGWSHVPLPIPNDLSLAGTTHFVQAISLWPAGSACLPSTFGFSSSRGLRLRIPWERGAGGWG